MYDVCRNMPVDMAQNKPTIKSLTKVHIIVYIDRNAIYQTRLLESKTSTQYVE